MEIGLRLGVILAVYSILFVFGFLYNMAVEWVERHGYDEGYTALMVVIGVAVTLIGVAFIDSIAAALTFGAFAASGFWMVIGSWWRYVQTRRRSQQAMKDAQA